MKPNVFLVILRLQAKIQALLKTQNKGRFSTKHSFRPSPSINDSLWKAG